MPGNTKYRLSVFNFAPTWDQFTLISILIGTPRRRARLIRGASGGTFRALKR